ncbi:PorP/SprF family type IX secretion system membrane protein [uncultured Winogradskyella sp.]|uniref:PorP/SprF family type IX secretion system membrane protein n=1 Tax=uncultured Winogradskyella sp. TaxID=395353 RepID=UPI002626DA49|nr:PorP/SprF family type IX secretion system membrane protein [uncultured Winogradskyella sp.]
MKHVLALIILCVSLQSTFAQQDDGVVSFDLPIRNSIVFNRFGLNPTFSFVRQQNKFIAFSNKREKIQFNNAPETFLGTYSGRFAENIGAGVAAFQQNYGVLTTFGGVLNFAYNVKLSADNNLTFGLNVGAYQSGINTANVTTNFEDPSLQNVPSNFLMTINPGINFGTELLDFGVSINNLVLYNFENATSISEDPRQGIQVHAMHTGYSKGDGFFKKTKFTGLIMTEFRRDQTIVSGLAALNVPKGIWFQIGYNNVFGVHGGIGLNVTKNIALEYNVEKAIGEYVEFGSAHEVSLAYRFIAKKKYKYNGDEKVSGLFTKERTTPIVESTEEELAAIRERALQRKIDAELQREAKLLAEKEAKAKKAQKAKEEAEAQAKLKAERLARQKAERAAKRLENEKAKKLAEQNAKLETEQRAREKAAKDAKLLEEQQAKAAEEKAKQEAKERARLLAEQKAQQEADRLAKLKAEQKAQQEAEEQARLLQEQQAKAQARLAEEKTKLEAEQRAKEKAAKDAKLLEEQQAKAAEEKAKQEAKERARLLAEQKAQREADRLAKLEAEQKAQQAKEQARLAAQNAKDSLINQPKDDVGKSMLQLSKEAENSKTKQSKLLTEFEDIVNIKDKDLKDLKKENDLSDQGITIQPKPFKSVSAENNKLNTVKTTLNEVIEKRTKVIEELKSLYAERSKIKNTELEEVNLFYRKKIEKLTDEQLKAKALKQKLDTRLEAIKVATDFEKRRRIKRAAFDNYSDRYAQDRATLQKIRRTTPLATPPLTSKDFDFGERRSSNIQILKNIDNINSGYYLVIAVHSDVDKRNDFITKVVASGRKDVDFFYDVNTSKYYIYYDKFKSIGEANKAMQIKGNTVYNEKMSLVKIEN